MLSDDGGFKGKKMDRRKTDRRNDRATDMLVIDFESFLKKLWQRKALIGIFTVLVMLPCAVFVYLKPHNYKATAGLVLENERLNIAGFEDAFPSQKLESSDIDTQVKTLSSPSLARETIKITTGKYPSYESLREFLKSLSISTEGKSRLVTVSYVTKNPFDAAAIVNTHVKEFVELQSSNRHEKIIAMNAWMEDQIKILKKSNQKKIEDIQKFKNESGIVLPQNSQALIERQISDLTAEISPIETRKLLLQAKLQTSQNNFTETKTSEVINDLKLQVSLAKQELASLKAKFGLNHPSYIAAKNRYYQAQADLFSENDMVGESIKADLDAIIEQETMLRKRLEDLNNQADGLRGKQNILESMESESSAERLLLDSFVSRSQEIKSQISLERPDARIESKAEIPTDTNGIPKSILVCIFAAFSLLCGILFTTILELIDRGIEHEDDVRTHLNTNLASILPKIENSSNTSILSKPAYFEGMRRLYTSISFKKDVQTILFTSVRNKEGKSTTALAFARYLSSISVPVAIINANRFSGAMNDNSQSDQHNHNDGIYFVSIENMKENSIDLLSSGKITNILKELKDKYRYILIDCSSTDTSSDAEFISPHVDEIIIVTEWSKTPKGLLKKSISSLRQHAKNSPSILINKRA